MIFPLDAMAAGCVGSVYLLPLTYFTMISQGIMLRGASLASLWLPFTVLAIMAVVVFTGATLRFRRDLAPGQRPVGIKRSQRDRPVNEGAEWPTPNRSRSETMRTARWA